MSNCVENDIIILSFHKMLTKWGKINKKERHQVTVAYFYSVDTFYADIDYIIIDFDYSLNE